MIRSCKISWGITALSLVLVATMAYMFMIKGSVTASEDGRTAIALSAGERDLVLGEMRGFLEAVQAITTSIAAKDMLTIASSARAVGANNIGTVPVTLMGKLPMEFKVLGRSTHQAFDDLGQEAQDMADGNVVLGKLGDLLLKCTECHAGYRLEVEGGGQGDS